MAKDVDRPDRVYDLKIGKMIATVTGISPLICHRLSEKSLHKIADKQQNPSAPRPPKEARDKEEEFRDSLYMLPDGGGYGFPAAAFKKAIVTAARFMPDYKMTELRGALHVIGDLLTIKGSEPRMREDRTMINGKTLNIAYRAEFEEWEISFCVSYNSSIISSEEIYNLIETAGFGVGVGDWRPECNGNHGMFELKRQ